MVFRLSAWNKSARASPSRAASPFAIRERREPRESASNSEHEVRDKLTTTWGSFHAADQTHCVRETRMGGESSYTELITCLEMARAVRKIHEEAEAARHPQNVGQR